MPESEKKIYKYDQYKTGIIDLSEYDEINLCDAHIRPNQRFILNPNADMISIGGAEGLSGLLDFSNVKRILIDKHTDLSNVSYIAFNPTADRVSIAWTSYHRWAPRNIPNMDFSGVKWIGIDGMPLEVSAKVKFNPKADYISVSNSELGGDRDFSGVNRLYVREVNFAPESQVKFNQQAEVIKLDTVTGLTGELNFNHVKKLELVGLDMSKLSKINVGTADEIELRGLRNVRGELVLGQSKKLRLDNIDFSKLAKPASFETDRLSICSSKGFSGKMDFSGIDYVNFADFCDLSHVTELLVDQNASHVNFAQTFLYGTLKLGNAKDVRIDYGSMSGNYSPKTAEFNINGGQYVKMTYVKNGLKSITDSKLVECSYCNLTDVKVSNVGKLEIYYGKLSGNLDFSNVDDICIMGQVDISDLKSIKFNPNGKVRVESQEIQRRFGLTPKASPINSFGMSPGNDFRR